MIDTEFVRCIPLLVGDAICMYEGSKMKMYLVLEKSVENEGK